MKAISRLLRMGCALTVLFLLEAAASPPDLVYRVPGMDRVAVKSNLIYKTARDTALKADVYLPQNLSTNASLSAIIFIVGDAAPPILREAKDWPCYRSYGRLAAASGFAGITFNHRSSEDFSRLGDMRSDIADLITFVRTNATALSVKPDQLCLWFFSGSGPHLSLGMGTNSSFVRCLVAYYPLLEAGRG